MQNNLINSNSQYLLQHASNPVYWQPWTDQHKLDTVDNNKLLIISIGYAACHWCHVMEKECFEDQEVARVMNANYVCYKIDREEFPAVDAYYMQALQVMTKQGGWPLNIVALPNGLPVWGATYVPKVQWIDILEQLSKLYIEDPARMHEYASKLKEGIDLANNTLEIYPKSTETLEIEPLLDSWKENFDLELGGYQRAPKFMMPTNLNFLHSYGIFTKDDYLSNFVELTLKKMAYGGIFDVVEGGFSRYSVDHKWHIPHFEKMLYDNAQLLVTYTNAFLSSKNDLYKEVVEKTVHFILENWSDPSGGFYASYDADSLNENNKLEEGAFYYWNINDLKKLISASEWTLFSDVYSINKEGFWEESQTYVLFQKDDLIDISVKHDLSLQELQSLKSSWEAILLNDRKKRTKPLLDDKIIVSWNAMLLKGLLYAQKILDNKNLNDAIANLATFLQAKAYENNRLAHVYKNNSNYIVGTIEDYAFTIEAFIEFFNHSQQLEHLLFAKTLTFEALDLFYDSDQGFFKYTNAQSIGTVFEIEDNVIPSANAIMSRNLFYLGFLFKNEYFTNLAREMTTRVLTNMNYASMYSEWLLNHLIFTQDFEYLVVSTLSQKELKIVNNKNIYKLILSGNLNIPILDGYKKQDKKFLVCNLNSCRIATNEIDNI